jgi:hypothetical protein
MSYYPIRQQRPAAATVLGILHLVFGILGLFAAIFAGLFQAAGPNLFGAAPGGPNNPGLALARALEEIPGQKAVAVAGLGMEIVLDVLLIAGGIGLLQMRLWGRTLSVLYAVLSILNHVFAFAWGLLKYPEMMQAVDSVVGLNPKLAPLASITRLSALAGIVLGLVGMSYPIIVLCFMRSAQLSAAFRGDAPPAELPEPRHYDAGWGAMERGPLLPSEPPPAPTDGSPDDRYKPSP